MNMSYKDKMVKKYEETKCESLFKLRRITLERGKRKQK